MPSVHPASSASSWPSLPRAPFVMLGLANVFVSDPELHTGLVLYGLAPCIAMVIIFTYLAKGNTRWTGLRGPQLDCPDDPDPVYARLLIGNVSFDVWVVPRASSSTLDAAGRGRVDPPGRDPTRRRGGHGAPQARLSALSILACYSRSSSCSRSRATSSPEARHSRRDGRYRWHCSSA